jgi:hypothetical protein
VKLGLLHMPAGLSSADNSVGLAPRLPGNVAGAIIVAAAAAASRSSSTALKTPSTTAKCTNTYCLRLWHKLILCSLIACTTSHTGSSSSESNIGSRLCSGRGWTKSVVGSVGEGGREESEVRDVEMEGDLRPLRLVEEDSSAAEETREEVDAMESARDKLLSIELDQSFIIGADTDRKSGFSMLLKGDDLYEYGECPAAASVGAE